MLGTERHESRRIDNQLRGRSGRQGDPGESRFYLSLQDELMRRFRAGAVEAVMERFNIPEDVPIESKMVTRQIKSAQAQIEGQNAEIRKNVLKYDEVLNKQRQVVYAERKRVLDGEDLHEQVRHMIDDVVGAYVQGATADGYAEDWDLDQLWSSLKQLYPVGVTIEDVEDEAGGERNSIDADFLLARLKDDAHDAYDRREEELGAEAIRQLERMVLLQVIDRKWREHLYEMDYLQEGISLRAYAQRDPVVEYQREGFDMFATMMDGIKEETVGFLFNLEVQVEESPAPAAAPVAGGPAPVPLPRRRHGRDPGQGPGPRRGSRRACSTRRRRSTAAPARGSVEIQQAPALGVGGAGAGAGGGGSGGGGASRRRPGGVPRRGRSGASASAASNGPVPQRALPLRLGQEVQALPRRPRRPRRRLTVSSTDGRFALHERAGRRLSTVDRARGAPESARRARERRRESGRRRAAIRASTAETCGDSRAGTGGGSVGRRPRRSRGQGRRT